MKKFRKSTIGLLACMTTLANHLQAQKTPVEGGWPVPGYESASEAASASLPEINEQTQLKDYLRYAALNNAGLEASFNRWKAALEKIPQAEALPDPTLSFGYFIEEVETRVGPQEQKVGLAQKFPWFGKLKLRGDVAALAAEAAYEEYRDAKLRLFYQVHRVYFEYFYLGQALAITDENIRLMKYLEGVAQSKFKTGAPQAGVIKAQVELGKLNDRLSTLSEMKEPMRAKFNAVLNRDLGAAIPIPGTFKPSVVSSNMASAGKQFALHNPVLAKYRSLVDRETKSIELARKEFYPDFMVGVDYISTGESLMSGARDSGKDPVVGMVGLELPLWRKKYKAGVREAEQNRSAVQKTLEDTNNLLAADLKMAWFKFKDAERKINLYRDTLIPQATQSLNVTEEAYRAGKEDFLNLIDAERLLLEFKLLQERAKADREISRAEIEMIMGTPLGPADGEKQ